MTTLFISDLHLGAGNRDKIPLLGRLLARAAGRVDALYILGDLFEVLVGDDDDTAPYPEIIGLLRRFSASGTPLFIMPGNRDFLIGPAIVAAAGGRLLDDPTVIDLHGEPALLMHGDTLCTRDLDYQAFRRRVRDPAWQRRFLSWPLWTRKLAGRYARLRSRLTYGTKPESIMDVDADTVTAVIRHHGVRLLIHGHTHRPAIHELRVEGQPARRVVLGDWYRRDWVLACGGGDPQLFGVEECLAVLG